MTELVLEAVESGVESIAIDTSCMAVLKHASFVSSFPKSRVKSVSFFLHDTQFGSECWEVLQTRLLECVSLSSALLRSLLFAVVQDGHFFQFVRARKVCVSGVRQWSEQSERAFICMLQRAETRKLKLERCADLTLRMQEALRSDVGLQAVTLEGMRLENNLPSKFEWPFEIKCHGIIEFDDAASSLDIAEARTDVVNATVVNATNMLRHLNFSRCKLRKLRMLRCHEGVLSTFLCNYRKLETLSVKSILTMAPIKVLRGSTSLNCLDLCFANELSLPPSTIDDLCDFILSTQLTSFSVNICNRRVLTALVASSVTQLVVSGCTQFSDEDFSEVLPAFGSLRKLSLVDCAIFDVARILRVLPLQISSFKFRNLSGRLSFQPEVRVAILELLKRPTLRKFAFETGVCVFNAEHVIAMGQILSVSKTLCRVKLSTFAFDATALKGLASAVSENTLLRCVFGDGLTSMPRRFALIKHRNACIAARAQRTAIALLAMRARRKLLSFVPREIVLIIAKNVFETRDEVSSWWSK